MFVQLHYICDRSLCSACVIMCSSIGRCYHTCLQRCHWRVVLKGTFGFVPKVVIMAPRQCHAHVSTSALLGCQRWPSRKLFGGVFLTRDNDERAVCLKVKALAWSSRLMLDANAFCSRASALRTYLPIFMYFWCMFASLPWGRAP